MLRGLGSYIEEDKSGPYTYSKQNKFLIFKKQPGTNMGKFFITLE